MSFVYTIGGNVVQAANAGYNDIIYNANTQLAWPTQFQDVLNVTAAVLYLTPSAGGLIVTLPDAKLASHQVLLIVNHTAHDTTLNTFLGGLSFAVNSGTAQLFIQRDNTTQDGVWDVVPAGGGVVAVTSVAAVTAAGVTSNNLTITGSPITSAGTFTFTLAGDLFALSNFDVSLPATGIAARIAANTWILRSIVGTANQITVINNDGVAGNPTISLPTIITGINNLTVGDLNLSANVITTTVANEDVILSPNGTGKVQIDNTTHADVTLSLKHGGLLDFYGTNNTNHLGLTAGNRTTNLTVTLPTTDPAVGQAAIVNSIGAGTASLIWATIATSGGATTTHAVARYLNTTGSLDNSLVILDDFGNLTGINSAVVGNIQIAGVTANTISTSSGSLILSPNGVNPVDVSALLRVTDGKKLALYEPSGSGANFTSFVCPAISVDLEYIMPNAAPLVGQIIYATTVAAPNYTWSWGYAPANPNLLDNGAMLVWQRNTSFNNATFAYPNNNNTYTADRWNLQSNGNDIVNVSRQLVNFTNPIASSRYALRSQIVTANTKFGFVQVLNFPDTGLIKDRTVMLQLWNAVNGVSLIKAAFVAWTGTLDVPLLTTSNFISAWNVEGVDPTLAANWSYIGTSFSVNTAVPFTYTSIGPVTINTGGLNNLAIFIWCDSTASAINSTWDMTCVKLETGTVCTPFFSPNFSEEQEKCMAYLQKNINYDTAIGTANSYPLERAFVGNGGVVGNNSFYHSVQYYKPFYNIPVVVTYPLVAPATVNAWSTGGVDLAVNSATPSNISKALFEVQNTSGGNITSTTYTVEGHWYADGDF